jgi:hypothetical protein
VALRHEIAQPKNRARFPHHTVSASSRFTSSLVILGEPGGVRKTRKPSLERTSFALGSGRLRLRFGGHQRFFK